MITVLLEYPDNVEVCSYDLPLPANVNTNESMLLVFPDDEGYWSYLNSICEVIDSLEYSRFFSHKRSNADKIRLCKALLKRLVDVKLTINL
jgi:hypothetical protein